MNKELQKHILIWLIDNDKRWQRINYCIKEFREYIYNSEGEYLIGGEDIHKFIRDASELV